MNTPESQTLARTINADQARAHRRAPHRRADGEPAVLPPRSRGWACPPQGGRQRRQYQGGGNPPPGDVPRLEQHGIDEPQIQNVLRRERSPSTNPYREKVVVDKVQHERAVPQPAAKLEMSVNLPGSTPCGHGPVVRLQYDVLGLCQSRDARSRRYGQSDRETLSAAANRFPVQRNTWPCSFATGEPRAHGPCVRPSSPVSMDPDRSRGLGLRHKR